VKAGDIAALMTAGFAQPTGSEDAAFHTGQIVTWDELSGVNTVLVNGVVLSNLKVIQSGIGLSYGAGDVVVIMRKQTQYFIMGKVSSPGAGAANQIQSQTIATYQTTGSTGYANLATFGPEVTINVGSSRRCLVLISAFIDASGTISTNGGFIGGTASVITSGASAIGHDQAYARSRFQALVPYAGPVYGAGAGLSASGARLFTASDGLNSGSNTFTVQYKSDQSSPACGFQQRTLTVIPF
jgi:hypothetical protein